MESGFLDIEILSSAFQLLPAAKPSQKNPLQISWNLLPFLSPLLPFRSRTHSLVNSMLKSLSHCLSQIGFGYDSHIDCCTTWIRALSRACVCECFCENFNNLWTNFIFERRASECVDLREEMCKFLEREKGRKSDLAP